MVGRGLDTAPDSHSRLTWKGTWLLPAAANTPTATGGIFTIAGKSVILHNAPRAGSAKLMEALDHLNAKDGKGK